MQTMSEHSADQHLPAVLDRMADSISSNGPIPLYIPDGKESSRNAPPPTVYREEEHSDYELAYIDEGTCNIVVNHQNIEIKHGDMFLIPPYNNHYIIPRAGVDCSVLWLSLELNCIRLHTAQYNAETLRMMECVTVPSDTSVKSLIGQIFNETSNKPSCAEYMVKGYLLTLTGYVCRPLKYLVHNGMQSLLPEKDEMIYNAIAFMKTNYANSNLSVVDMARHVAKSSSYFNSHFREVTGYSPYQYLLQYRLERASHLLCTTVWSVDRIGSAVGFQYPHHFSVTFKRVYGMTPTSFRKQAFSRSIPVLPLRHHQ